MSQANPKGQAANYALLVSAGLPGIIKAAASLALAAFQEWVRDRCSGLAAALAFNAILAAPAFCAIFLVLASLIFSDSWTKVNVLPVLIGWTGPQGAEVIEFLLRQQTHVTSETIFSLGILGLIALFWGTSEFFGQLKDSLETIWDVRREQAGLVIQLKKRFNNLWHAFGSALIMFAGFSSAAWLHSLGFTLSRDPRVNAAGWAAGTLIAFTTFTVLAAYWLRVLPPVHLAWRAILPWAALIALFHLLGQLVFQIRHGSPSDPLAVDLAETLILILLWFDFAGMVFLYGAELMRISLQRQGHPPSYKRPQPASDAMHRKQ